MTNTKIITCVSDYCNASVTNHISLNLNVEFIDLPDTQQLFRMMSSKNYHTDAIVVDLENLTKFSNVKLLDVIMTLKTLTVCYCSEKENVSSIPIGMSVSLQSNVKLIKEVLSTGYVTVIYPTGSEFTMEEKVLAIDQLLKNQKHVPDKIRKMLNEKKKRPARVNTKTDEINLTQRQNQILDLIINKGASNKLIARMLNISESTVKLHMTQILKKHGLTNRTQLALFAKPKTID